MGQITSFLQRSVLAEEFRKSCVERQIYLGSNLADALLDELMPYPITRLEIPYATEIIERHPNLTDDIQHTSLDINARSWRDLAECALQMLPTMQQLWLQPIGTNFVKDQPGLAWLTYEVK